MRLAATAHCAISQVDCSCHCFPFSSHRIASLPSCCCRCVCCPQDKCQLMLSQKADEPPYPLTDQLVLLYALQKGGTMLGAISLHNTWTYRSQLLRFVHANHSRLYEQLQQTVRDRVFRGGNSTGGSEEQNMMLHSQGDGAEGGISAAPSTAPAVAAELDALWKQLDVVIDDFNTEFIRKYEQ